MGLFAKKCEYCKTKIEKNGEVVADVKVPEFRGFRAVSFCSQEHVDRYRIEVKGTKRTKFCPSCGV